MRWKNFDQDGATSEQVPIWNESLEKYEPKSLYRQYMESNTQSSTTSTSYIEKVSLVTSSSMPAGKFHLSWTAVLHTAASGKQSACRIQVDNTSTVIEYILLPPVGSLNVTNYHAVGGSREITMTSGSHNIDMDFKAVASSTTVKIYDARLHLKWVIK
jgi:hypothetical protein